MAEPGRGAQRALCWAAMAAPCRAPLLPAPTALPSTGARDGALMVWDARTPARIDNSTGENISCHLPVVTIKVRAAAALGHTAVAGLRDEAKGQQDGDASICCTSPPADRTAPHPAPAHLAQDAHALTDRQKRRRTPLQGRTRPSVTSLTFLQGPGNQLATGGGWVGGAGSPREGSRGP